MTAISNVVFCKQRTIVTVLWPLTFVMFGTPLVTAQSQESVPAQVDLATHRPVVSQSVRKKKQATPTLRSLTHPFPLPAPRSDAVILTPYNHVIGFSLPAYPVASGGKAVWYSTGVNQIHCSLLLPNSTWLGTEFGLKRLDNKARTTRHFCALDGLPYNRITALAAQGQQLYCCAEEITADDPKRYGSETNPHRSAVALCRYHAESGKWEKVAEEMRYYPQGIHVGQPEQSKVVREYVAYDYDNSERQIVTVGGDHACLVMGPGMPGQSLALLSPVKGGETQKILCPSFAKSPFRVSFAHADQDSLWIGSDLGLLRYDFKAHRWDRLLSDLVVTGGCPAEQGALWLLTRRFDPVHPDKDGTKLQTEHWQITHFLPGKNAEHFAILDHENREKKSGDTPYFANIVASGDRVWTTEQLFIEWGHAQNPYYPAVYSLNPNTRQVALDVPFASGDKQYQSVPDALLANALTGWHAWTPIEMPERFPGWTCPAEENDHSQAAKEVRYADVGADGADGRWYTERESVSGGPTGASPRQVLKHADSRGAERESFPFPAFTIEPPKPIRSPDIGYRVVAADHNAVWIVGARGGEGSLFRFDRGTHAWINIPAQEGVSVAQYNEVQWRADGTSCWLNTPGATYRLDLKTQRWENVSARLTGDPQRLAFQQVIPDGEDVWLVAAGIDPHNALLAQPPTVPLYRYHINTDRFIPVEPSPAHPLCHAC